MFTSATERFRTRVLVGPVTTAAAAQAYLAPTPGVIGLTIRATVKMGNAADVVLSLKSSDDASGTNATDFPVNTPIFVDNVRQADGKAYTVGDAAGNFVVDFCVNPSNIPNGKFIGLSYPISNAANLVSITLIEEVAYRPHA